MDRKLLEEAEKALPNLPPEVQQRVGVLIAEARKKITRETSRTNFMDYVNYVWPEFIHGKHHEKMARAFERVASGECKRLIINLAPRHSKSEFASYLLPSWYLGLNPTKKIIQCSNKAELAVGFGRKVRNLVDSQRYKDLFPDTELQPDSKSAGRWNTSRNGAYYAIGVSGSVTGIGADLLVIDDPHDEQEAAMAESNPAIYDKTYEWYTSGPRQRLQPGGAIIIVQTRWSKRDLTGRVIKDSIERGGDEWEVIELPAVLPSGKPIWPEFWKSGELEKTKLTLSNAKWMAQYQQQPTSDVSAIIKREWWKRWDSDTPPPCEFTIQGWDTAFTKNQRSDYSACTTWGVFYHPDDKGQLVANIILLNSFKERMEFPELKKKALQQWKEFQPDSVVIEAKASGLSLIQELRAIGVPAQDYTPGAGNDKISRLNSISDLFASGIVWIPNKQWAEEIMEEVCSFPGGIHDDLVDSMSMCLIRFRKGGFVRLPSDELDEPLQRRKKREYY